MTEPTEAAGWPEHIEPDGSHTEEPHIFEAAPANVLTPMGMIDSYGSFARGLGPRWVKRIVFGSLLLMLLAAVVSVR